MEDKDSSKALFIRAYFDDLQGRISFLAELRAMGRKDEALMLCCCYIEALGSRAAAEPEQKAKNYCSILAEQSCNELWRLVHPKQLKGLLSSKKLFNGVFSALEPLIDGFGKQLIEPQEVLARLAPTLNEQQRSWLQENTFRGSMSKSATSVSDANWSTTYRAAASRLARPYTTGIRYQISISRCSTLTLHKFLAR